jgi:two-component system response regulator MprA
MQSPHPEKPVILIAERDQNVRELQQFFLDGAGYAVEFADDGESALERARTAPPALLVTEILIPKLDGLALCRRLKEDPATSGIMVLIFSILAAGSRAREAGADAFLTKPLAEHHLVDTVRQLLARRADNLEKPND